MKKWVYFLPIMLTTACTHLDNYMLGKDNTPAPQALQPVKDKIKLNKQWSVAAGLPQKSSQYLKIKPRVVGSTLYTADPAGLVKAVDKNSGKVLWSKKLDAGIVSGPALGQGLLAVGTDSSKIKVLHQATGQEAWQVDVSGDVLSSPLIAQGKLIAKTVDGSLVAYKLATGEKLWVSEHGAPGLILKASSSPVLLNDQVVLVGYSDGKMDAIDVATGQTLWQRSIAYSSGASDVERLVDIDADPIVQGSRVFLGSYQGYIGALSLEDGQFIWRKPASIYKNMLVHGDTLYATDSNDIVWSLNKYSGQVNWKQVALQSRGLTEPSFVKGRLVVGDKTGLIHVLSAKTGDFLSRVQVGSAVNTAPVVAGDTFYVATADGKLSRFSLG